MQLKTLEIAGTTYPVIIEYARKSGSSVSISKAGIKFRISSWLPKNEQEEHLDELRQWAIEKIRKQPERFKAPQQRDYLKEQQLQLGDELYHVNIEFGGRTTRMIGNNIHVQVPQNIAENLVNKYVGIAISKVLAKNKLPWIEQKLQALNQVHVGGTINGISLKYATSRWGSCTTDGNITISTRLLFAPEDVLNYVCIHELAHLIEPNHSKKFWKIVERAMPDYKEKDKWLKKNRHTCVF